MIVLDTDVLSAIIGRAPDAAALRWLAEQPAPAIFTTAVTEAEILYGVAALPKSRRRSVLEHAVRLLFADDLAGRVLPFDRDAAREYAAIAASRRQRGRPLGALDAQIAAIARSRGAALATRNTADFEGCGIRLIDPWKARA